jgi:hypothetical protein
MIKGMVSLSAVIIPGELRSLARWLPYKLLGSFVIGKIAVNKFIKKSLGSEENYTEVVDEINEAATGKSNENIKQLLKKRLKQIEELLEPSEYWILYGDHEAQIIDKMAESILENVKENKRAIVSGNILDIKVLINRKKLDIGFPYKHTASLLKLMEQLRMDLRSIYVPILVVQGLHDNVAIPKSGDMIYKRVRTKKGNKKLLMLNRTGHLPMLDFDKEEVFEESVKFIIASEEYWVEQDKIRKEKKKIQREKTKIGKS